MLKLNYVYGLPQHKTLQGVNTADSAVRLTHLPTNTVVESQEERAQAQNKKRARAKLQAILYQREWEEDQRRVSSSRKLQIGNMNRNEKIRTYNFNRYIKLILIMTRVTFTTR